MKSVVNYSVLRYAKKKPKLFTSKGDNFKTKSKLQILIAPTFLTRGFT